MYKVKFEARIDQKFVDKFKKEIRNSVIENGLDVTLEKDLEKYKKELLWAINSKNPNVKEQDKVIATEEGLEKTIILPKSDEDIIKQLTGLDLSKVRGSKDYTTSVESKVAIINDGRVRLRLPLGPYETFEENYERAKNFFNSAIYVSSDGAARTRYLLNTGYDLSMDVKVVCSRENGDTTRSRQVFESYKNSNIRPRQSKSEIGNYAEWTLKQSGVAKMLNSKTGFVDLTQIVSKIKEGKIEEAFKIVETKNFGIRHTEITQKLDDLRQEKNLNPDMEAYTKITKLISSMSVEKIIKQEKVQYNLMVEDSEGETTDTYNNLYTYVLKDVSLWIGYSSPEWIKQLENIIQKLISKYENAANPTKV